MFIYLFNKFIYLLIIKIKLYLLIFCSVFEIYFKLNYQEIECLVINKTEDQTKIESFTIFKD